MLAIALALLSAGGYGTADYLVGAAARRASAAQVNVAVYAAGVIAILLVLPFEHPGRLLAGPAAWGAVSGCGCGAGAVALAAGFRRAPYSVAGPLSALIGAGLSVAAGVALGDRPGGLAWAGLLVALPAIFAVAASAAGGRAGLGGADGVRYGILAGIGCAVSLAGLGQARQAAGLWPILSVEAAALLTVAVIAALAGDLRAPAPGARSACAGSGALGTLAAVAYLLAVHAGMLAIVAVVTSLFPAVTVGLAVLLAGERLGAVRAAGVGLAVVSVALIALGG